MKTYNFAYQGKEHLAEQLTKKGILDKIEKGSQPLIQVFSGIPEKEKLETLRQELISLFPAGTPVLGTTTAGEILNRKVYQNTTVVSVSLFDKTRIKTYFFDRDENTDEFELGKRIAREVLEEDTQGLLMFSEGIHPDLYLTLKGIEKINNKVKVFGGGAGDNGQIQKTFVFNEKILSERGIVVATFTSKDLLIHTGYKLNWEPIGKIMTITKAEGKRVYEIDGLPPLEIYRKYLGEAVVEKLPSSTFAYPLIVYKGRVQVARASTFVFEDGSMLYAGHMETGDKVRLSYGYIEHMLEDSEETFNEITSYPAESIFIYSCVARFVFLKHLSKYEVAPLREIAPVAGFFTYCEFFHQKGQNELLNDTMTYVAMSEKNVVRKKEYKKKKFSDDTYYELLHSITHLANSVTGELEEMVQELAVKNTEYKMVNEELKATLEHLKNTQDQLILSEKMAVLGQLVANIAHELNTPLAAIQSATTNIKNAFYETLKLTVYIARELDDAMLRTFFNFIDELVNAPQYLSSKEERRLRKELQGRLEGYKIHNASLIARELAKAGFHGQIEPYKELFNHIHGQTLIDIAIRLSRLQLNQNNIITAVEKTTKVIKSLKNYSYKENFDVPEEIDLKESIEDVLTLYYGKWKRDIEVTRIYTDEGLKIIGFPSKLSQVWTNIFQNAVQVLLETSQEDKHIEIKVSKAPEKDEIIIKFEDNGPGIPLEIQDKIFEPFFTTKAKGEGTGLGLDISKKIVEEHQGKIWVESEPGKTAFYVCLPINPDFGKKEEEISQKVRNN